MFDLNEEIIFSLLAIFIGIIYGIFAQRKHTRFILSKFNIQPIPVSYKIIKNKYDKLYSNAILEIIEHMHMRIKKLK